VKYAKAKSGYGFTEMKLYVPCIMGQWGVIFSGGVPIIASRLRGIGVVAETFAYGSVNAIFAQCNSYLRAGYSLGAVGFSLGTSTVGLMQQTLPFELVVCLAESSLERRFKINHKLCKRSVLWHGWDFLSDAGVTDGFDLTIQTALPHLLIPYSPRIQADIVARFQALL
jgi:hypothetical protein